MTLYYVSRYRVSKEIRVRGNIIISIDIFSKKINILSYCDELMNRVGYSKIPPSGHLFLPTCAMKTKKNREIQNWKKYKQNRDKDLLTELPKKTFNLGWDKWEQPITNT
jgi:hypothetical protein